MRRRRLAVVMIAVACARPIAAQLPKHPENLQVLPKTLSTDSVFALMLDVADGLGVTCGYCHVGGDRPNWDSTHFASDSISMKRTARQMFRLTDQLNHELLPAIGNRGAAAVLMTCATCHRGAPRPVTMVDTITTVLDRLGVDSALAAYTRISVRYAGGMAYDLTEFPLRTMASHLMEAKRYGEAIKLLEFDARLFPRSAELATVLAKAYRAAGVKPPTT